MEGPAAARSCQFACACQHCALPQAKATCTKSELGLGDVRFIHFLQWAGNVSQASRAPDARQSCGFVSCASLALASALS
jgi:hypothetical protein